MKNNVRRAMPTATAIAVALLLAAFLMSFPGRNKFGLADASEEMPIEEYVEWVNIKSLEAIRNSIKVNTWEELGDMKNLMSNAGPMYQSITALASRTDLIVRGKVVGYDLHKYCFNDEDYPIYIAEFEVYEVISRPVCEAPAVIDPAMDVVKSEEEVRSEVASVSVGDILRVQVPISTSGFEEKNGEIIPIVNESIGCFKPYNQMALLLTYDRSGYNGGLADYSLPCIFEACFSVHDNGSAVTSDEWVASSVLGSMFRGKEWDCQDVSNIIMNVRFEHADRLFNLNKYDEGWANCSEEG